MIHPFQSHSQKGFTLIELMVVIVIIAIISTLTYAPYNYYSNRAKIRIGAETLEQIINRARLLSVHGQLFPGTKKNANVSLVLTQGSESADILLTAYESGTTNLSFTANASAIKESLQPIENNVRIGSIKTLSASPEDPSLPVIILLFRAPNGVTELYQKNSQWNVERLSASGVSIIVGIGGITEWPLSTEIKIPLSDSQP